jgi:hypothetical protein
MNTTFQNSAQVLSIGIFFTLLIVGLSASLPESLYHGLVAHGVSPSAAARASHLPPVSTLFAAFLGYNPVQHLIGSGVLSQLPATQQAILTGRSFFPGLIAGPFRGGLHAALDFGIGASLLAVAASWSRGAQVGVGRGPSVNSGLPSATDSVSESNGSRPSNWEPSSKETARVIALRTIEGQR